MKITDYISGKVEYNKFTREIPTNRERNPIQLEVYDVAGELHEKEREFICNWIAQAINEKLEKQNQ